MVFEAASLIVIIISVILHEVAHGYAAYLLGDPTAKLEGRLTLNPISHIDPIGTLVIPLVLFASQAGFLFGWAKPVPYNPYNLKKRFDETIVAAAGPMTNVALALLAALLYHALGSSTSELIAGFLFMVIFINLFLAVINLLPLPPLDGSKIISTLLPVGMRLRLEERIASVVDINSILFMVVTLLFIVFVLLDPIANFTTFLTLSLLG